jgi:hypothetical protein
MPLRSKSPRWGIGPAKHLPADSRFATAIASNGRGAEPGTPVIISGTARVKRLIYYSLSWSDLDPRSDILWQLELSVRSLRTYNTSVPIWLFTYGDVPRELSRRLSGFGVTIQDQGTYERRLAELVPRAWPVLCQYPILHKFLNFSEIAAQNPEQVLLLDCDTLFFGDVESLFDRYTSADCYGREDLGARRRRKKEYDPSYLDEEMLVAIGRQEGVRPTPPFSCGLVLFNHRLWSRFQPLEKQLISYAWRLLLWMAIHPLPSSAPFPEGRGVWYLRRHFHRLAGEDAGRALPYPSGNRWLLEQVALWLTLGHIPDLTYGDISPREMLYFSEFRAQKSIGARLLLCHYGSRNTKHMADWISGCHDARLGLAPKAPRAIARRLQGLATASPPSAGVAPPRTSSSVRTIPMVSQPQGDANKLPGVERSWALRPEVCPCDLHFLDYLRKYRIAGKTIFHFGTGEHHVLGRSNEVDAPNDLLATTVSRKEYERYIDMVSSDPRLARHYKVLFADIYTLTPNVLPRFDLVTLFHLHEFWSEDRRKLVAIDDDGVIRLFLDKLKPGGRMFFYRGSRGFEATRRSLEAFARKGLIRRREEFQSLSIYGRARDA